MKDETPIGHVDKHNLHIAWARHGRQVHKYASQIPEAKDAVTQAKAKLAVVEADLKFKIRASPNDYGLKGKPAVKDVEAAVILQDEYQEALKRLNRRLKHLDYLNAAMTMLDHQKRVIEGLVTLFGMEYFARTLRVDRETQSRAKDHFERVDQSTGFSRRRKKK